MKYLIALLMLTSCSGMPKVPTKVLVPVPVSCVKETPVKPNFISHEALKVLDNPNFVLSITGELLKYEAYTSELEVVVKNCK